MTFFLQAPMMAHPFLPDMETDVKHPDSSPLSPPKDSSVRELLEPLGASRARRMTEGPLSAPQRHLPLFEGTSEVHPSRKRDKGDEL